MLSKNSLPYFTAYIHLISTLREANSSRESKNWKKDKKLQDICTTVTLNYCNYSPVNHEVNM